MQGVYTVYIDPTYMIRAIPTNTQDHIYCTVLGQSAVHGAFAGFTGFTVGLVNTHYTYLPIPAIIQVPSYPAAPVVSCSEQPGEVWQPLTDGDGVDVRGVTLVPSASQLQT